MSLHRALSIPELVLEIIEDIESRQDTLRFALTCKAMWGLAIPRMWNFVDIRAIHALLPVDDAGDICPGQIEDVDVPSSTPAWAPLLRYARYITTLNCMVVSQWNPQKTIAAMRFLGTYNGHQCLFPNLQHLWVQINLDAVEDASTALPFFQHAISPKLQSLMIAIFSVRVSFWTDLMAALRSRKSLQGLTLIFSAYGLDNSVRRVVQSELVALIKSLPRLEDIAFPILNIRDLYVSAPLPSATSISLDISDTGTDQVPDIPTNFFPVSVRRLHLRGSLPTNVVDLVRAINSDVFDSLDIEAKPLQDVTFEVMDLFNVLCRRWPDSLRTLKLCIPVGIPSLRSFVEPLRSLHRLQTFSLTVTNETAEIDDSCIDAVSQQWPDLQQLHIYVLNFRRRSRPLSEAERRSRATPESLLHLAMRCTRLRVLLLPVDFSSSAVNIEEARGVSCPALVQFTCPDILAPNPDATARFLRAIFPNLVPSQLLSGENDIKMVREALRHLFA